MGTSLFRHTKAWGKAFPALFVSMPSACLHEASWGKWTGAGNVGSHQSGRTDHCMLPSCKVIHHGILEFGAWVNAFPDRICVILRSSFMLAMGLQGMPTGKTTWSEASMTAFNGLISSMSWAESLGTSRPAQHIWYMSNCEPASSLHRIFLCFGTSVICNTSCRLDVGHAVNSDVVACQSQWDACVVCACVVDPSAASDASYKPAELMYSGNL